MQLNIFQRKNKPENRLLLLHKEAKSSMEVEVTKDSTVGDFWTRCALGMGPGLKRSERPLLVIAWVGSKPEKEAGGSCEEAPSAVARSSAPD